MQGLVTDRTQANVLRRSELAAKGWANMTADEQAEWLGSPLFGDGVNQLPYGPYYSSAVELKHTNDAINAETTAAGSYLYAVLIVGRAADFVNQTMTLSADYIGTSDGGNPQIAMYWHDGNGYDVVTTTVYVPSVASSTTSFTLSGTFSCAASVEVNPQTGVVTLVSPVSTTVARYNVVTHPYVKVGTKIYKTRVVNVQSGATTGYLVTSAKVYTPVSLSSAGSITFETGANAGGREYLAMYIYVTADTVVEAGASSRFRGIMLEFGDVRHEYVPYTEILPTDTTKGAYNYADLNRVERAAAELSDLYGLDLDTKTDWTGWDVPQKTDMVRYITNVKKIRHASMDPNSMAAAPDGMTGMNYNDANNIEKILLAAHENTDNIIRFGELYSGEV